MKRLLVLLVVIAAAGKVPAVYADAVHAESGRNTKAVVKGDEAKTKNNRVSTIESQDKNISPVLYEALMKELLEIGQRTKKIDHKIDMEGELRVHYAINSEGNNLNSNSSALRMRLGFNAAINKVWQANALVEGTKGLLGYDNGFDFSRFNVLGKLGKDTLQIGSFGYTMADGNIYDSEFKGVQISTGGPVKYTFSIGETDSSQRTYIGAVHYDDYDYSLEAGIYNYQSADALHTTNTIKTAAAKYNFSSFSIGARVLAASTKDVNGNGSGYVFQAAYGDLKTWQAGTYDVSATYYRQPQGTYIAHGMNGLGTAMRGFRGYGLAAHYTIRPNLVVELEYYNLRDLISGQNGKTWWSAVTYYF